MKREQIVNIIRPFYNPQYIAIVSSQTATVYNLCDHHINLHILFANTHPSTTASESWIVSLYIFPEALILVHMGVKYA